MSDIPEIEDYELERRGLYIRISIDPEDLPEDQKKMVRRVLLALGLMDAEPLEKP